MKGPFFSDLGMLFKFVYLPRLNRDHFNYPLTWRLYYFFLRSTITLFEAFLG